MNCQKNNNFIEDNYTKKSTIETYLYIGTKEEIANCVIYGTIYLFLFLLPENLIWFEKEGRGPPKKIRDRRDLTGGGKQL